MSSRSNNSEMRVLRRNFSNSYTGCPKSKAFEHFLRRSLGFKILIFSSWYQCGLNLDFVTSHVQIWSLVAEKSTYSNRTFGSSAQQDAVLYIILFRKQVVLMVMVMVIMVVVVSLHFHFQFQGMVAPQLEKTDLQGAVQ